MRHLIILAFIISALSCSKSGDSTQQNRTDLLVNKKWKISGASGKTADGTVYPDEYSNSPSYSKDDYYIFKSDLTFELHDNLDRHPNEPDELMEYGTWSLTNNDTYIQLVNTKPLQPGETITYFPTKILELTDRTMKWESYDTEVHTTIWTTYTVIN